MDTFWNQRLARCRDSLLANNFDAFIAQDLPDARRIVIDCILPEIEFSSVSYGDSLTLFATGVLDHFKNDKSVEFIDTFESGVPREQIMQRRHRALSADLFFTGSNALVESGMLVKLDMVGNRVGAIAFGPKHVVLTVGRNKLVPDLESAMARLKNLASPANAIRHGMQTPCAETSVCVDCSSKYRICNVWTIHEKSFPKGRIKVILINEDLGL
jgi:hypothetical protein